VVLLYHAFLLSRKLRQLAAGHRNEPAKSWLFRFASLSLIAVTRRLLTGEGASIKRAQERGAIYPSRPLHQAA